MRTLEVWLAYEGPRAPERIDTGVYEADDPRLFGLAVYLVDNGNARWVEDAPVEDAPVEDAPVEDAPPEGDEAAAGAGNEESPEEPAEDEPDTPTRRRGRRG